MTTPSKPPFRFFGTPKSKSTKSLTTGPTSLIFVPDRRCAAAGANRSRPWKVSESSGRPSLRFVISRTSFSPSRRAAGISSPLSGPTRRAPSQTATMARRFVPTPGSTTPTWTAKGKYGTAEYRTNAPCRTSCGRTLWSRSTIVSSESMERMAPFIAPTYPPGPKSVVSVTIPVICHPSPNLLETFFDALELLLPTFQVGIFFPGLCHRLFEFRLAEGVALEQFAENVVDLAAKRLARLFQLFKQASIDFAFARVGRTQVPEVTDFSLSNAVDAAEALFNSVRIPGQVIVDHEVCAALKIDAFAGSVSFRQVTKASVRKREAESMRTTVSEAEERVMRLFLRAMSVFPSHS